MYSWVPHSGLLMVRRRACAVSNHACKLSLILRDAREGGLRRMRAACEAFPGCCAALSGSRLRDTGGALLVRGAPYARISRGSRLCGATAKLVKRRDERGVANREVGKSLSFLFAIRHSLLASSHSRSTMVTLAMPPPS